MLDLRVASDPATGEFDLAIADSGDLKTVDDLSTAILVSLLTDARADPSQVITPEYRRGWIGDAVARIDGFRLGSLLWLTEQRRATQSTANEAAAFARQALQWMLDRDEIAKKIDVLGEITGPGRAGLDIRITAPDGTTESQYIELWEKTAFIARGLPPPIVEATPFSPLSVPEIVVWGDARFSEHEVDAACGVSFTEDIVGTADYFQANAARRPLLLRGSGGWLYRFDGVDDYMATLNQALSSLRQGSAFFIYKPTAGATIGDRFFTLGFNGFTDSVKGLTFSQQAGDFVRFRGDNGNLQVDVQGTGNADAPFGMLFRWGPALSGADGETSTFEASSDPNFTNEIGSPSVAVVGAGFDGVNPDPATAAAHEMSTFAIWSRRVSDFETLQLLDYAGTRLFTSPEGEPWSDCTYFTDDKGFA